MQLGNIMVSLGAMSVLVGLTIMFNDPANKVIGGVIALLGLAICIGAYVKVQADDRKELDRQRNEMGYTEKMATRIEDMSKNIKTLIKEIRKDRKERGKDNASDSNN